MAIQLLCPNGHRLSVHDDLAGKTGRCPRCKAQVIIPFIPGTLVVSEDEILDFLDIPPPAPLSADECDFVVEPTAVAEAPVTPARGNKMGGAGPKKCVKCGREIPGSARVCPRCHTYIAELADF